MSAPDEDELLVGAERLPPWVVAVIAVVVGVSLAYVSVRAVGDHGAVSSKPSVSASVIPTRVPREWQVIPLDGTGEPVVDAVLDNGHLTVIRTDSLLDLTLSGTMYVNRHISGDDALGAEAPSVRLFIDRDHGVG